MKFFESEQIFLPVFQKLFSVFQTLHRWNRTFVTSLQAPSLVDVNRPNINPFSVDREACTEAKNTEARFDKVWKRKERVEISVKERQL